MVRYMDHYIRNKEKNGIEIYFDKKPSSETLMKLKENHWKWFRAKGCWYNRYIVDNEALAKELCEGNLKEELTAEDRLKKELDKLMLDSVYDLHNTSKLKSKHSARNELYKASTLRKDSSVIERDYNIEKSLGIKNLTFYYYAKENGDIEICGEIYAHTPLKQSFCLCCTLYDEDGDVIETTENYLYGKLACNKIKPASFFTGFPFGFRFFKPKTNIARIRIVPKC